MVNDEIMRNVFLYSMVCVTIGGAAFSYINGDDTGAFGIFMVGIFALLKVV